MNMRDAAMVTTLLWCSIDSDGEPLDRNYDHSALWREDRQKLQEQFYTWSDAADDILIANNCGHLSLDEILGDKAEHLYILVREGHGISMTDDWSPERKEYKACQQLERIARAQGELNPYVGDDGKIYLSGLTAAN